MDSIADRILDAAERRARAGGYNGFSFRDIAADVGIKSASVHYHFPNKADLGAALARRYTAATLDALGPAEGLDWRSAVRRVAGIFLRANDIEDRMCLCGILGAERDALPASVAIEVQDYFTRLREWLSTAMADHPDAPDPVLVVAALEGALIQARVAGDPILLKRCVDSLAG
ncbi:MAG: TetR/AcrR family transcriptional regulator [Sphingomonadales bacterium]|nr:MAG: TetR/AcrR family transcriptional regulator [Sphingomonadales bacterium]